MVAKAGRGLQTSTSYCALPADAQWSHPEQLEQQVARRQQWCRPSMASSAGGVRWTELDRRLPSQTFGMESEHRTKDARTLQDRACAPVKVAVSCGHGTDAQSVPAKALS